MVRAFACLVVVLVSGFASAQDLPPLPVPAPPPPVAPQPAAPQFSPAPAPSPDPNAGKVIYGEQPLFERIVEAPPEPVWRTDVLLGAPTGLRVQRQLPGRRLWVEGGAGAYLAWPTVFAGVRGEGTLFDTSSDVFSVRPGIDAYYLQGWRDHYHRRRYELFDEIPTGLLLAIDFDLSWRHRFSRFVHGEVALKLGVGPLFADGRTYVMPVGALAFGLNY